tara:strand:+ start:1325 stop:1657 length:333 start_codon:yes stop_codon:yes gene_type:complete
MAVTKTWQINTMKRDVSDGYVTEVVYRVIGSVDSVEKARKTGSVYFTKPSSLPSDFIAFASLNAETVLNWVKTTLNADVDTVSIIEADLETEVNEIVTPTSVSGLPDNWS